MGLRSFLSLVEIKTKFASMIPLALGTVFALFHFQSFVFKNFLFLFVSILAFDMLTTGLNNYFDFKRAVKREGYGYETHNAIVNYRLSEKTVLAVLAALFFMATLFGMLLYIHTGMVVLALGALSFLTGICYSFGPVPISRTPLGELLSGLFMGFVILFLAVYIHVPGDKLASILVEGGTLIFSIELLEVGRIFLISVPAVCGIANIMLANNICDIEDDIENRRYTLPVYVGRKNALLVFRILYYAAFADILAIYLLKLAPAFILLALLTFIPVYKNIKAFGQLQTKKDTFVLSVINFVTINSVMIVLFGALALWNYFTS